MIEQLINNRFERIKQNLQTLKKELTRINSINIYGRVHTALGVTLEGYLLNAKIGDLCLITDNELKLHAEVVAIDGEKIKLLPYGSISKLSNNATLTKLSESITILCSNNLSGKIINGMGEIIGSLDPKESNFTSVGATIQKRAITATAPDPLERPIITEQLFTGIKSIDGFLSCGKGQRLAIFAAPGMGKTTLMGMILRNTSADIIVIALVGERGREVQEFIKLEIDPENLKRCVLVVATSDCPVVEQVKAPYVAQTIAEYFRDQGKDVLLFVDSITRFARAQREVGLSSGEPVVRGGFPPSVFMAFPKLMERAGNNQQGSITAFYTVLMQGYDISQDPIAEEIKSIVDGHIMLSKSLVEISHFPAIDILESLSRVADRLIDNTLLQAVRKIRLLLAKYNSLEFLLRVGEYKAGSDPVADEAIRKHPRIMSFLQQPTNSKIQNNELVKQLIQIANE